MKKHLEKVQLGLLAAFALIGISTAFIAKPHAKKMGKIDRSRVYGILAVTSSGYRYVVETFDLINKQCEVDIACTCSFTYTSVNALTQITKTQVIVSVPDGRYTLR